MSRTVHHVKHDHRDSTREERDNGNRRFLWVLRPMARHRIRTLRYSAALLAAATKGGHRPRPKRVVAKLDAHTYPRTYGIGHTIEYNANRQERALRAADRVVNTRARQTLRASQDAVEAAWDIEYPDPRHRHFAVWDSW